MIDEELEASDVARIGDVLANREEYQEADEWIGSVINQLELSRSVRGPRVPASDGPRAGRDRSRRRHSDICVQSHEFPVFCPDIQNSPLSVGFARAQIRKEDQRQL